MEAFQSILLDVWREACRHIEIDEFVQTIAPLLTRDLPLSHLYIGRIDPQRPGLETASEWRRGTEEDKAPVRTGLGAGLLAGVLADLSRTRLVFLPGNAPPSPLQSVVPFDIGCDRFIGLLGESGSPVGLAAFVAAPGEALTARHRTLADSLLQPFAVALENDSRLREMTALREAAEADRRSLLRRLGRQSLGDTIVGAESGLRAVMDRVDRVARSDVPVLILGETGSGKELIARAIHLRSARSGNAFMRVNCGAISPELIDSELFGHERGAFTGAVEQRKGWFERADGGTLLLDEVGELSTAAQVRLLRILQDGWLERVGGHRPIHVDVRIVAATNRDLASMVADGHFREDLYYRLAVFPILLPPLRERRQDIADLACHFAERAATRFGLRRAMPTAADLDLLRHYDWPGNIRELAAVIDRAAILGDGARLEVAKALGGMGLGTPGPDPSNAGLPASGPAGGSIPPLDEIVKRHIETALAATAGRVQGPFGCARLLGVNPNTLRARMRKLGVDWRGFRDRGPQGLQRRSDCH